MKKIIFLLAMTTFLFSDFAMQAQTKKELRAKKLGGNMLLIPSSIHEFLVMPLDSDIDVCNLSEFICEVNSTEVRDEEVLGERYYIYDSKTDTVY